MKKLAYEFGIVGYFAIFILCTFEIIMISVNSYGIDTIASLYLFFGMNLLGLALLIFTMLGDRYERIHKSFNLNNRGVAILYLGVTVVSVLLLINSSRYNLAADSFPLLIKGFIYEPEIYLPIIPVIISGILFVVSSKRTKVQKEYQLEKETRVSHS
ncbi:hypothetical protein [uncultured Clostridium sp.]|uniref:hypothetical protein n=1 Tax=uncultured Clostridium sp. TaxID=59620 RepID=UPI00262A837B|nr:hypothetical protein [uncultured Clostridium sp.]